MLEKYWDKILVGFLVLAQMVMIAGLWSKLEKTSDQLAKTEHFAAKLAIDRQYFYDKIVMGAKKND